MKLNLMTEIDSMDNIELKLLKEEMELREAMNGNKSEHTRCPECKSEEIYVDSTTELTCLSCGFTEVLETFIDED